MPRSPWIRGSAQMPVGSIALRKRVKRNLRLSIEDKHERYNKYKLEYAASHPFWCEVCDKVLDRGSKNRHIVSKVHMKTL